MFARVRYKSVKNDAHARYSSRICQIKNCIYIEVRKFLAYERTSSE